MKNVCNVNTNKKKYKVQHRSTRYRNLSCSRWYQHSVTEDHTVSRWSAVYVHSSTQTHPVTTCTSERSPRSVTRQTPSGCCLKSCVSLRHTVGEGHDAPALSNFFEVHHLMFTTPELALSSISCEAHSLPPTRRYTAAASQRQTSMSLAFVRRRNWTGSVHSQRQTQQKKVTTSGPARTRLTGGRTPSAHGPDVAQHVRGVARRDAGEHI